MARTYTFTFNVVTGGFNLHDIFFKKVFRPDTLPTLVLAQWYAGSGQGEGYSVVAEGNAFTQTHPGFYRAEEVSLENSSVTSSVSDTAGSFDVGNINANEWLRYDVYNPNSGNANYTLTISVANNTGGGQIRVDLDTVGNRSTYYDLAHATVRSRSRSHARRQGRCRAGRGTAGPRV